MDENLNFKEEDLEKIGENLKNVDLDAISNLLEEKGIFSARKVEEFLNTKNQGNEKWYQVLFLEIFQQGTHALERFIDVLKDAGYSNIACKLSNIFKFCTVPGRALSLNSFTNLNNDDEQVDSNLSFIDDEVVSDGIFSCCVKPDTPDEKVEGVESVEIRYGVVKVRKGEKFYSPPAKRIYHMGSRPKGFALIIVNQDFPGGIYPNRCGAGKDQYYLQHLFTGLGYTIFDYFNKTSMEMRAIIKKFSKLPDHEFVDSCVVAISTHGESNRLVGTDNEYLWVEDILDYFNNERCPTLLNKPKLFFFQACRGNKFDYGISAKNVPDGGLSSSAANKLLQPMHRSPSWTDMIIAYSTIPEHVALRNIHHGSWFIQALTEVFMNHAWNTPLSVMFNMVSEQMMNYETEEGQKQVPEINHRGWKRDLYFNPGLYGP